MSERDKVLSDHKIDRIEFLRVRARYPRLHGKNAIKSYHGFGGEVPLARITTSEGATGWGVLSEDIATSRIAAEKAKGKKLTELFSADIGILSPDMKALDLPLHDLAGRILGISVAKMINPEAVDRVGMYDGAIYMNDIIPEDKPSGIQRVLDDCAYDIEHGHRALKIKIGRSHMWMEHDAGLARDIELVNKVHEQFQSATLLVDANDGYSVEDAINFLKGTKNVPLYWFEEPMREEEKAFRELKDYMRVHCPRTMIADGESFTNFPLLFDLAGKGLLDVWMPDVCGTGFTEWRKLMPQLAEKGYIASPHAWGYVIKTNCCAHLAAAYPQLVPCVEAVLGTTEGVDASGYVLKDGIVTVPDKPGFGMELEYAIEYDRPSVGLLF